MFNNYLLSCHKEIITTILHDDNDKKHFSLLINFLELFEVDSNLGTSILSRPEETLKQCDACILEVQRILITDSKDASVLSEKVNVHTRIYGLPTCPEVHRKLIPKNEDLGLFLQVTGTVVRMTSRKMLEYKRQYMCKKCKFKVMLEGDYDQKYIIMTPKRCSNPEPCTGVNMVLVSILDSNHCKDYQEIKMQEQTSKIDVGMIPNNIWVTLEDDLVEVCKPGDNITVCGTVRRRWKPPSVGKKLELELVLKANHVQINNDQSTNATITSDVIEQVAHFWNKFEEVPLYGRDLILRSFCPQIYGMYIVKLAVATILAGGSSFYNTEVTGIRKRTEPHLLLVGDPGMGKSQILRYAAKVVPRSVLTTGVGSTSAGLTVTALIEDGEWQLEGGALVLADGGICCIDEFNSMKEHDKASIHEAMEQQTISVAKASIVCKLSTRCSILAATNPKGPLNPRESLSMNCALASPLLSRFDLIILIRDNVDEDWDSRVCDYILRGNKYKSKFIEQKHNSWPLEMLQAYYSIIKKLNPVLTDTSRIILSAYYQHQRKNEVRNKARTTVRLLDSLVRLSQAHARLMYHKNVEIMDAVTAITLMESSMQSDNSFPLSFDANANFPEDPMECYEKSAQTILKTLNLDYLLDKPSTTQELTSNLTNKTNRNIDIIPSQIKKSTVAQQNKLVGMKQNYISDDNDLDSVLKTENSENGLNRKQSDSSPKDISNLLSGVINLQHSDSTSKSNEIEPKIDEMNAALNYDDVDDQPKCTLERSDISQSSKIQILRKKFSLSKPTNKLNTNLTNKTNKDIHNSSQIEKSTVARQNKSVGIKRNYVSDEDDLDSILELGESENGFNPKRTPKSLSSLLSGVINSQHSDSTSNFNEIEPEIDDINAALNYDVDDQPKCTLERSDISQSSKIKILHKKFSFDKCINKLRIDSFKHTDSPNSSHISNTSIFEDNEEVELDL